MPKKHKKITCIIIAAALMLFIACQINNGSKVHAEAVGVVNVSAYLNVRKGQGTSYDLLK